LDGKCPLHSCFQGKNQRTPRADTAPEACWAARSTATRLRAEIRVLLAGLCVNACRARGREPRASACDETTEMQAGDTSIRDCKLVN
jgi:hypothetical protein